MSDDRISKENANPPRDELFRLLTEEMKDISEAEKLNGWTPWVILATLVSGLWMLIQDSWAAHFSSKAVLSVFLISTVTVILVRVISTDLGRLPKAHNGKESFFFLHAETSPLAPLVLSAWMAAIAFAFRYVAPPAGDRRFFTAAFVVYLIVAIFGLIMAALIFARLPFPMATRGPRPISGGLMSAIFIFVSVGVIVQIVRNGLLQSLAIPEIRMGGVLSLEAFGIVFLSVKAYRHSGSRQALSEIRRDLVLAGISTEEGRHRTRTVLQGMWLSDIVMEDMRELLKLTSKAKGEYEEALAKVAIFESNDAFSGASSDVPEVDRLAFSNMLDTLESHEAHIREVIDNYQRLLSSLRRRLEMVRVVYPSAGADGRRLVAVIQEAEAPVDELQSQFVKRFLKLQEIWNVRFPKNRRSHTPFRRNREGTKFTDSRATHDAA